MIFTYVARNSHSLIRFATRLGTLFFLAWSANGAQNTILFSRITFEIVINFSAGTFNTKKISVILFAFLVLPIVISPLSLSNLLQWTFSFPLILSTESLGFLIVPMELYQKVLDLYPTNTQFCFQVSYHFSPDPSAMCWIFWSSHGSNRDISVTPSSVMSNLSYFVQKYGMSIKKSLWNDPSNESRRLVSSVRYTLFTRLM